MTTPTPPDDRADHVDIHTVTHALHPLGVPDPRAFDETPGYAPRPESLLAGRKFAFTPPYADQGDPDAGAFGSGEPGPVPPDPVAYDDDPDRMLERIRQGLRDLAAAAQLADAATTLESRADAAACHRIAVRLLTSSVVALDAYLVGGRQLPAAWSRAAGGAQ